MDRYGLAYLSTLCIVFTLAFSLVGYVAISIERDNRSIPRVDFESYASFEYNGLMYFATAGHPPSLKVSGDPLFCVNGNDSARVFAIENHSSDEWLYLSNHDMTILYISESVRAEDVPEEFKDFVIRRFTDMHE